MAAAESSGRRHFCSRWSHVPPIGPPFPSCGRNLDGFWFYFFLLRQNNLQNTIFVFGTDLFGINHIGQREGSAERAIFTLDPVIILFFRLFFEVALTFEQ